MGCTSIRGSLAICAMAAGLLAGCHHEQRPTTSARPIIGLERGDALTFNPSPDGSQLTVLYDTAVVEVRSGEVPQDGSGQLAQSRGLRMLLGTPSQTLRIETRGALVAADPQALAFTLAVGDQQFDLAPGLAGDTGSACVLARVTGTAVDLRWTAAVRHSAAEDRRFDLDSIDIATVIDGEPGC